MKLSPLGSNQHCPEASDKNCLNSELWHACAGPLVSLPSVGSHVVYFPQGHSEQVAVSTNKEAVAQTPSFPNLSPQLICQLHNVTMHADIETDEVYAQMTLQPLSPQEQKDVSFLPADLGSPNKQPTNYFCKTLTASDTSTHGGFSVPRRAAEKVFPPLDFSLQPPVQELIARDLHNNEWKFRHIFRGQPKRHLLTTGWSVFVSAKRLVTGDSVLFIWNEKNQLLLGIRRANRQQTVMPSSVLSSDSMHLGLLAAAAHAASTNSRFTIFYNPRASPCEFVIPLAKYVKAVYHSRVSVGMRFRMLFETEESSIRRYMGTITGISDLDSAGWPNSHWRSVKVGWDESTVGEKQQRVSLWEIEPLTTLPMHSSPFPLRLKRPWPLSIPASFTGGKTDGMGLGSPLIWLGGDVGNQGMQFLNQGMNVMPCNSSFLGMQNNIYQGVSATAAIQEMQAVDPSKQQILSSMMQFQQVHHVGSMPAGMAQPQMLLQSQPLAPFPQTLLTSHSQAPESQIQQQLLQQNPFNNLQMQQQRHHHHQQTTSFQPVLDHQQVSTVGHQGQVHPQTAMQSTLPLHQNFSETNIKPVAVNGSSPLHIFLGTVAEDEVSELCNVPRSSNLFSPSDWPGKRVALDPLISIGITQAASTDNDIVKLGSLNTNLIHSPVSLPPFPGRECLEQEGSDTQMNFLFGVNIDSSSLLMPNGFSNLQGVDSYDSNATVAVASSGYMNSSCADYSLNSNVTSSSCIGESLLASSNNLGHVNSPNRTFVKVYKSGSFGRSLDISKFSSYHELRSELAQMFGPEGQLEDHLRSGWQLVFVDRENDVLLLGDDPWPEFVNSVWCIKILSPEEVQGMGMQELELRNSISRQKSGLLHGSFDGYTGRQEARNISASIPSVSDT